MWIVGETGEVGCHTIALYLYRVACDGREGDPCGTQEHTAHREGHGETLGDQDTPTIMKAEPATEELVLGGGGSTSFTMKVPLKHIHSPYVH